MDKYSVLLVDDEQLVFQVMMKKVDWDALGFTVCGYAANGIEALEIAEEHVPDVVLTDVKMPYMDGLTLSKRLKAMYPDIKIIILSGFDEFEYAKEAIRIEAEEYLLKPIDAAELSSVFGRVKETLDKEMDEKRNIDKLKEHYLKSLPILQDNFCISLLEGRINNQNIGKYASDYQLDFNTENINVTVVKLSYRSKNGVEVDVAPFLMLMSVQKLVEEQLSTKWNSKTLIYLGDIVIITQFLGPNEVLGFTDDMDKICKMALRVCNAKVTAGIGYTVKSPGMLNSSYLSAKNAISYRVFSGDMQAINIAEIDAADNESEARWEEEVVLDVIKYMRQPGSEKLPVSIRYLTDRIEETHLGLQEYRVVLMRLVVGIMDFMNDYHISTQDLFSDNLDLLNTMMQLESPKALNDFMNENCVKLQNMVDARRNNASLSFVSKAENYIKENYANKDVSIDSICGYLNVSSAYFSTIFKKATGKTFVNYLTDYRMEAAVRLLETTEDKTYEIADKVGYADPNYFSYVFKKQYGVSPVKYKQGLSN